MVALLLAAVDLVEEVPNFSLFFKYKLFPEDDEAVPDRSRVNNPSRLLLAEVVFAEDADETFSEVFDSFVEMSLSLLLLTSGG